MRNHPHPATASAEAMIVAGYQEVRPRGFQRWEPSSWIMKRPTRVPASMVVRMKSASKRIAKWYQSEVRWAPKAPPKIVAIPTASDGAPPVRPTIEASPIDCAIDARVLGVTVNPHPWTASDAE